MNDAKSAFNRVVSRAIDQAVYSESLNEEAPYFPQHIHIEPTNSCNLNCIHCVQDSMTRKRGIMDWSTYQKIIDEISPLGCAITLDVQGEPLLHPNIIEMVEYANKNGCHVSILTNGTRMSKNLATSLIDAKLDRIVFSFDAIDKHLYEHIRRKANYEKTLYNILNYIKLNYEKGGPSFICMSIINQAATKDHLETYKNYFNRLPIDTIFVSDLLTMSGASSIAEEIDLTNKKEIPRTEWPICRVPWENLTVNWYGSVCTCPLDFNVLWPIGNVKNTTLQDMWNNEEMKIFRQSHLNRDYSAIEENGVLCSECNCLWDPEYDFRNYKEFAKKAIFRQAQHYAVSLTSNEHEINKYSEEKYNNLIEELRRFK